MTILGFSHYNLRAPRALLDTLARFYAEVVGLQPGPRPAFASHGHWLYAGAHDVLHLTEARAGEARPVDGRPLSTFDHAAFAAQDVAACEARLQAAGVAFTRSGVPGTGVVQLFFHDPAGNGVELNFAAGTA